jgi:pimeloyl-ACP methyl ester carboxylesterase
MPETKEPPSIATAVEAARANMRAVLTPTGARGAVVETVWTAAHLAMYPLGLLRERPEHVDRFDLAGLGPAQRGLIAGDVEAAGTPILMLHGLADNRAIFAVLRRTLRRRGFGTLITLNLSPTTRDMRAGARDLALRVEAICAASGYERIHVIGHSMGGLIGRYYVQCLGGDERVHTLVTLGTPHGGTVPARLLPTRLGRQLAPGSDLLRELDRPAPGCRTRFVAFWSDLDQLVLPHESGRLEHPDLRVRNVEVRGVGHMSLPIDGWVAHQISTTLSQLDPSGAAVPDGARPDGAGGATAVR